MFKNEFFILIQFEFDSITISENKKGTAKRMEKLVTCSSSEIKMQQRLKHIHESLTKMGCDRISQNFELFSNDANLYLQDTESRMELLEWLIGMIYPGFDLDADFKNIFDDDPHTHRIKRINVVLWQLGVMPMSKHTKNLDYVKYTQGLLGPESSLNLLYDLTELASSKFSPNIQEIEKKASGLLLDLVKNYQQLVNVNYDPYGVIFPSKHFQNSEDVQKVEEMYQEIKSKYENYCDKNENKEEENECEKLISDLESYQELFKRKYEKLLTGVEKTVEKYGGMVPATNEKEIEELHEKRMLKISPSLCQSYKKYSQLLASLQPQNLETHFLKNSKEDVISFLNSINEIPGIYN